MTKKDIPTLLELKGSGGRRTKTKSAVNEITDALDVTPGGRGQVHFFSLQC